ncbi:Rieske 2Fe-2S domain-containing protein [Caenimonas soli]|uniref:Rieske 2Fe-2S domain-containing protein n=1 Tax=Caenimonas soli TaxID=2735555 RepID=UPI001552571B|nr:Rieske 2Fe-2S domain-containing protein [Caenimonas soli]NPC58297.1 Rieske 2Fe-2S domain-containing protein [Caenimonas soli]
MLSTELNERLTRVGRGTSMGEMMRRYWHPIATSAELEGPDCDPIVRKLLGQKFVLFRDTAGTVGVMDEHCLHRGASMALGRVEEGGIRCIYHGWKFSVDGTILDTPNHADPRLRERLKANTYLVREQSGLIWTYIGPKNKVPPFRRFAYDDVPAERKRVMRVNVRANYLQVWEAGTDSSHVGILHSNVTRPGWLKSEDAQVDEFAIKDMVSDAWDDMAPKLELENTGFGYHYVGIRKLGASGEQVNVRLTPVFLPTGRMIIHPDFYATVFDTPMDDEMTATFIVDASDVKPLGLQERLERSGLTDPRFYKDQDFVATEDTGYFQDREAMRQKRSWSGFQGLTQEDSVVCLSMGPVFDRATEHLVAADAGVVRLRQRLQQSLEVFERGGEPFGVRYEDMSKVRGFDKNLPGAASWKDHARDHTTYYPADAE